MYIDKIIAYNLWEKMDRILPFNNCYSLAIFAFHIQLDPYALVYHHICNFPSTDLHTQCP